MTVPLKRVFRTPLILVTGPDRAVQSGVKIAGGVPTAPPAEPAVVPPVASAFGSPPWDASSVEAPPLARPSRPLPLPRDSLPPQPEAAHSSANEDPTINEWTDM
jgi:hypothetical protein